jgi:hypothetical protein
MHALLVRRPGTEGEGERKEDGEDLTGVETINGLRRIIAWVKARNNITCTKWIWYTKDQSPNVRIIYGHGMENGFRVGAGDAVGVDAAIELRKLPKNCNAVSGPVPLWPVRSTVASGSLTTSSNFSPSLSIVHRITRGSLRMIVPSERRVRGDVSKCIVQ